MATYDDGDDFLYAEMCPCEFCGELYSFDSLIQHQTGCRSDLTSFGVEDWEHTTESTTDDIIDDIIAPAVEKLKVEVTQIDKNQPQVQNSTVTRKTILESDVPNNTIDKELKNTLIVSENSYELKENTKLKLDNEQIKTEEKIQTRSIPKLDILNKDYLPSCTKEKLMSFGSPTKDTAKECDKQNQAYNDCIDDTEDFEDISNLSDDDCPETLEEFWKRAKDFLKSHRVKNI